MKTTRYLVTVDAETGATLACQRLGAGGELVDAPLPAMALSPAAEASPGQTSTNAKGPLQRPLIPHGVARAPGSGMTKAPPASPLIPHGIARAPGAGMTRGHTPPTTP